MNTAEATAASVRLKEERESSRYRKDQVVLHWISAVVIIWATLSGFGVTLLPKENGFRHVVELINPQITTLFIPLFVWRGMIYLQTRPWTHWPISTMQRIAWMVHAGFYMAISAVLVTGVLMMDHSIMLLGILPMPQLVFDAGQLAWLKAVHHDLCAVLGLLVVVHVAAVAKHQLTGRKVLRRMSIPRSASVA